MPGKLIVLLVITGKLENNMGSGREREKKQFFNNNELFLSVNIIVHVHIIYKINI